MGGLNLNNLKPKISIIIPAYNVEKYIKKCINSIIGQTYENIEIIAINDGSTDKTATIIDKIAKNDKRVKVIHRKNCGVSASRNFGIDISTGEYLVFVDGDDYLASDYIEYMYSLIKETNSEFCFSKFCFTKASEKQIENDKIEVLSPEEATALLLSPNVIVGCWNKIYKKSLITENNINFSTTLFYGEGLTFITTLSQVSKFIGVGSRKVYYYRRNNESSATTKFDISKLYNGEKALKKIKCNLKITTDKVLIMFNLHFSLFTLGALVRIKSQNFEEKYKKDYKRWINFLRRNTIKIIFYKEVSIYRKLMLVGGCISPWLMMKLDTIRRERISNNSIGE